MPTAQTPSTCPVEVDRPAATAKHENHYRSEPARNRIDEAHVRAAVPGGQEREVRELERGRGGDPRSGCPGDMAGEHRDRREECDREHEDDRGRGFDVARTPEKDVPEGVKEGSAEREPERR